MKMSMKMIMNPKKMKNMLTEEQIKNLKKGDKLIAEVQFHSLVPYGDLMCLAPLTDSKGEAVKTPRFYNPSCLSLPLAKPKYDPNRKFRKGDIVEPCKGREVYACEWEDCVFHKMDGKYEVQGDEKEGHVSVIDKETGIECYVSAFAIELVTPVEEREPYRVETGGYNRFRIKKGNLEYAYFPFGEHCVLSMDEAKAAAEAERDRLNDEHRKKNN